MAFTVNVQSGSPEPGSSCPPAAALASARLSFVEAPANVRTCGWIGWIRDLGLLSMFWVGCFRV